MIGDKKSKNLSFFPKLGVSVWWWSSFGDGQRWWCVLQCCLLQAPGPWHKGSRKSHLELVSRSGSSRQELCSPWSFLTPELLCLGPFGSAWGGVGGVRPPSLSLPFLFLPYLCRPRAAAPRGLPPSHRSENCPEIRISRSRGQFVFSIFPHGKKK